MRKPLPTSLNLTHHTHNAKAQQSPLLALPEAILTKIYNDIPHPLDQIAFTLTCKQTAHITSNIPLNQIYINVRSGGKTQTVLYAHRHLVLAMAKWAFIPSHTQFCKICEKFLPKQRVWTDGNGRGIRMLERVDWMWAVARWRRGGKICPSCQILGVGEGVEGGDWVQTWPEGYGRGPLVRHMVR